MKRRFKVTGSGAIRCMSPGFVHKRFNKSKKRLNRLSKGILVPPTYEKAMKKLGFVSRRF
jgi:ribosomal protein L35